MKLFDSLTHVTHDGRWFGEHHCDAALPTLLADMDAAGAYRACLVAIADYVDNAVIIQSARAHPTRFVPIAGLNPRELATTRRVDAVVKRIKAEGFAGIKLHPRLNGYDPLDAKCIAAIDACGEQGLVVLLDTLFRRKGLATRHAPDVIDHLAAACPGTKMLLLHGTGPTMMELYEIVRCNDHLLLDLSYTLMRYRGSTRLDEDMHFLFKSTDQLVTVGSDFPEYTVQAAVARLAQLTQGIEAARLDNITHRNLERLFAGYAVPAA
ncbi:MAG: amidohydrolase family protein [Rubrivivax sp.]|nr:amidohydrolase family protein [Rubrivivax sp.]